MRKLLVAGSVALAGLAVAQEVRKPSEQRNWEGELFGVIPYDFRPPTVDRLRERMWNPQDGHVFTPMLFGVGWSLNFGALARRLGLARE